MSVRPFVRHRRHRLPSGPVVAAVLGAMLAAGCTASFAPPSPSAASPEPSAAATTPPTASPVTAPPATPTSSPTEAPTTTAPTPATDIPATPPQALLADAEAVLVPGTLGSYTWGDGGSDSPWIVVRAGRAAGGRGPWTLSFVPDVPIASWTAAWAAIRNGRPGQVEGSASGAADSTSFAGPAGAGPWTLKVEVTFAGGGSAAYYWRLRPAG
jgi:hypothetical protein